METILTRSQVSSSTSLYRYVRRRRVQPTFLRPFLFFSLSGVFVFSLLLLPRRKSSDSLHQALPIERDRQHSWLVRISRREHVECPRRFFSCVHLFTVQSCLSRVLLSRRVHIHPLPPRVSFPERPETRANPFCTPLRLCLSTSRREAPQPDIHSVEREKE